MRENAERAEERRSLCAIPNCQKDDMEEAIETRIRENAMNTAVATSNSRRVNPPDA
jgi:hypothetical protein